MANCNSTGPSPADYWLNELHDVCAALGFIANQVGEQQSMRSHQIGVASTLHILHAYLRIQLGTAPEEARGEVRHG